jgi:GT2 family glycosyltransferase
VIVVDNASSDGSAALMKKEFPQVNLIENTENRGFATANNQGIAITKGRYVLLLNSDTVVLNDAITRTIAFANAHPRVAVVGCRVLNPDGTLQQTCFMFPSILNMLLSSSYLYKLFPRNRFFGRERMTWWDRRDTREVDVVTGCFMLVRREAIEQVGMMDEWFFMYGEETDWCYRFKKAGWKIIYAPVGQIIHLGGASSSRVAAMMTLQLRGAILQFMAKHYSKATYILSCVLTGVFFAIRIPFWLVRAVILPQDRPICWNTVKVYSKGMFRLLQGHKGLLVKAVK